LLLFFKKEALSYIPSNKRRIRPLNPARPRMHPAIRPDMAGPANAAAEREHRRKQNKRHGLFRHGKTFLKTHQLLI